MTDKLHCPFCGAELRESSAVNEWYCPKLSKLCPMRGSLPKIVWNTIIDGKKAQDALNRAITEITDLCTTILYCSGEADNEIQMIQMRDEMVKEAKARIFGEITSITKQEE